MNKHFTSGVNPFTISFVEMCIGALLLSLFLLCTHNFPSLNTITKSNWIYILLLSTLCTNIPFLLSIFAIKKLNPFIITLTVNLEPIYDFIFAALLFQEYNQFSLAFYFGSLLILLSVFVEPTYRFQGVGTDLMTRLEQELIFRGCTDAKLIYTSGQPTTPAFERLLQKCNWTPPKPRMLVCKSSIDKIVHAPWMQKTKLPDSYSIFPWSEITEAERLALQKPEERFPWIPETLIPFIHEENFEPLNSLGLRYQGELVGWMITHRVSVDTIRYACGFLRPDLQKMGRFIPLLANAIHIQNKANILNCICVVSLQRNAMVNFVKKRMAPYLTSLKESQESYKLLI
jgi:uncharacterized membrane protein